MFPNKQNGFAFRKLLLIVALGLVALFAYAVYYAQEEIPKNVNTNITN